MVKSIVFRISVLLFITSIILITSCKKSAPLITTQKQTDTQEIFPEATQILNQKIELLKLLIQNKQLIEELINANTSSKPYTIKEEIKYNNRWLSLDKHSPEVMKYSLNKGAAILKEFINKHPEFYEIYISDVNGQIVSQTEKNYIFCIRYQPWWKNVYNEGKGEIFIGNIRFDRSAEQITFPLYLPIYNPKTNRLIGICNAAISLDSVKTEL